MILITKTDEWSNHAGRLAKIVFGDDLIWIKGNVGDPMPEIPEGRIISFLSPWIILNPTPNSINFHPGNTDYPGIGCYNFALHENSFYYGAVCHYMLSEVDSGQIIREDNFRIMPNDTVETLKFRTMIVMLNMFHEVICNISIGREPLISWPEKKWKRKPFTRKQLNQLYADFPNTRATRYPDE